jgi:hypothetical protein
VDAEKFDKVVLDLLYDELDELTRASAIRHTEQSGRAKALYAELRATREVGALPLVEPPDDLEERIMRAEERARAERPLGQRLGALVSIAASYAMRPQLAMAAVLMLMVGSSLLFLRVKPGPANSVQVTERGVPESDKESVTVPVSPAPVARDDFRPGLPAAEAPRPAARGRAEAPKAEFAPSPPPAVAHAEKSAHGIAEPEPAATQAADLPSLDEAPMAAAEDLGASAGGPSAGTAAAGAGKGDDGTAGASAGCESDLPRYEAILAAPANSSAEAVSAARAAAAECYRRLGRIEKARVAYQLLLKDPRYAEDARRALSNLPETNSKVAEGTAPRTEAARRATRPPAKAAAKQAAPPAAAKP